MELIERIDEEAANQAAFSISPTVLTSRSRREMAATATESLAVEMRTETSLMLVMLVPDLALQIVPTGTPMQAEF